MAHEIIHTDDLPAYHRQPEETSQEYEMFVEFCRIPPSSRNIANYSRRTSLPPRQAEKVRAKWCWDARATMFDRDSCQLRPDPTSMDDEAAIAGQLAAAQTLLDLGLNSLALKNPALIPADKAIKLVERGVEIQRRALGQADLNVQFSGDDLGRVNKLLEELNVEDAEVVSEETDGD